ncbi:hypothetical protein QCA50_001715 [Cerrena zonata]|uniref:SMP-LTD domain-containing protein n=1 Tax=Cerrena zonata TaxID=2478898 RepID=A0AAW0GRS3_9APHY
MANAYIFTLQPTFTQGLLLGQLSILCLLVLVLKYLFFDTDSGQPYKPVSYHPRVATTEDGDDLSDSIDSIKLPPDVRSGSGQATMNWLNVILQEILNSYRMKLCDNIPGTEGEEIARRRVEEFANKLRPAAFVDPIRVHSVNLGVSAPRLSEPRHKCTNTPSSERRVEFTLDYVDTISISFSTSVLFNYPFVSFARLPVSLTISLSLFASSVSIIPPEPGTEHPALTIVLPAPQTDFVLDLKTTSLMGSRAKLADVPKLHELITHQIRKVIVDKGTWKIALPGLASVQDIKEDIEKQQHVT